AEKVRWLRQSCGPGRLRLARKCYKFLSAGRRKSERHDIVSNHRVTEAKPKSIYKANLSAIPVASNARSSKLSMYSPGNCRAVSSSNGSSSRSATRLTDVYSFAITSPEWSEWDERHRR